MTPSRAPVRSGTVILAAWLLAVGVVFIIIGTVLAAFIIGGRIGGAVAIILIGITLTCYAAAVLNAVEAKTTNTPKQPVPAA